MGSLKPSLLFCDHWKHQIETCSNNLQCGRISKDHSLPALKVLQNQGTCTDYRFSAAPHERQVIIDDLSVDIYTCIIL